MSSELSNITTFLNEFIIDQDHPCIMAQSIVRANNYTLHVTDDILGDGNIREVMDLLSIYVAEVSADPKNFQSFIVAFRNDTILTESDFENLLWAFLNKLHENDTVAWDSTVSADPKNPKFSFSLHGHAFYIVGLHPNSSRKARRFPHPIIVFNLHRQFEALREMGVYTEVRDRIRQRDKQRNGSVNNMLQDFGRSSEAKQYSGRQVDTHWKCPFSHK